MSGHQGEQGPATRWGGAAVVAGSITLALGIVLVSTRPLDGRAFSPTVATLFLAAGALLLLGLPGLYALQAARGGPLALVAHVLLETGLLFLVLIAAVPLIYASDEAPGESATAFILGIALTLGLLLTGAAIFRAGVLPRASGLLVLGATAGFFFDFFVAEYLPSEVGQIGTAVLAILLAAGFGSAGSAMWTGRLHEAVSEDVPLTRL